MSPMLKNIIIGAIIGALIGATQVVVSHHVQKVLK